MRLSTAIHHITWVNLQKISSVIQSSETRLDMFDTGTIIASAFEGSKSIFRSFNSSEREVIVTFGNIRYTGSGLSLLLLED
jgi:hypothetical protein